MNADRQSHRDPNRVGRPAVLRAAAVAALVAAAVGVGGAAPAESTTSGLPGGLLVLACSGCPGSADRSSLYTLTPSGRSRKVPGTERGVTPSWSPDGRFIAYSVRNQWLRVIAADGTRPRRLTSRPSFPPLDDQPTWSPNGREILFRRAVPSQVGAYRTSLWRIPAAGGRARLMHAPRYGVHSPSWSPDGKRIAYGDTRGRLWVISARGRGQRPLGPPALRGESPRFAPGGRRIAFIESGNARAVSVLTPDTGAVRRLLLLRSNSQIFDQAWSPDGRWIALARVREYACDDVPLPQRCEDFEVLAIRVRDRATRVLYTADNGAPSGLDWRR